MNNKSDFFRVLKIEHDKKDILKIDTIYDDSQCFSLYV